MGARDGRGASTGGSGDGSEHEPAPPPIPPRSHRSASSSVVSQPTSPIQSTAGIPILSVQPDPAGSQQPTPTQEKKSAGGALRINIKPGAAGSIRAVTPEPIDLRTGTFESPGSRTGGMRDASGSHTTASPLPRPSRGAPPVSLQSSPRSKSTSSNSGGGGRRQGSIRRERFRPRQWGLASDEPTRSTCRFSSPYAYARWRLSLSTANFSRSRTAAGRVRILGRALVRFYREPAQPTAIEVWAKRIRQYDLPHK